MQTRTGFRLMLRLSTVLVIGLMRAPLQVSAQPLDSLMTVWCDLKRPVADRLDAINELCWVIKESDVDSALSCAHAFLTLARQHGSPKDVADAYNAMGVVFQDAGQSAASITALQKADSIYALVAPARRVIALNNLSSSFQEMGDHWEAIRTLLDVVALSWSMSDTSSLISAYGNLGVTYASRKESRQSVDALRRSAQLSAAIGDSSQYALTQGNLGGVFADMGLLDSADFVLRAAMAYYEPDHTDDGGYSSACTNLGTVLQKQGAIDEAENWFLKGLSIDERSGHLVSVANNLVNLGGNRLLRKDLHGAIVNCDRARRIAEEAHALFELQHAHQCLSEAYEGMGMYAQALEHHRSMVAVRDSVVNEENTQEITRVEMRHEFTRRQLADSLRHAADIEQLENERTIAQLHADRNRNRTIAVAGAAILLIMGGGLWYRLDRKHRQARFEKEAATLETQALRSQMNPHFIFNALNSINAFVQQNDQDRASSYLTKFARVMRRVLENSRHSEVPLNEDLDALRGYLELERMRMQEKFDYTIEVVGGLNPEEVLVPPLVVQPFVENAIWHGISRKEGQGRITLRVARRNAHLIWVIEDDGVGRATPGSEATPFATTTATGTKKTSLGTAITRARLDLVQRQHGATAGFKYIDLPAGTRVEVEMPFLSAT
ncbi:MAG: histidine kinase [Flavobacteriales bacterium]|nr:histidine kinase [Flavobacteriales bacterium]